MTKQKLTLTVDDALIEKMKSQATKEKRSLSMMTEGLYREYLERGIEEAKANLPPKAQAESELLLQNLRALWHRINETSTEELLSAIFGEITVPEVSSEILLEQTESALKTLTRTEEQVIKMRFGLNESGKRFTQEEVGNKCFLTPQRISQIEAKALRKLRHPLPLRILRPFFEGSLARKRWELTPLSKPVA